MVGEDNEKKNGVKMTAEDKEERRDDNDRKVEQRIQGK